MPFYSKTILLMFYDFRSLTEKVVPGNRVTVMGIYSIKKSGKLNKKVKHVCLGINAMY